MALMADPKGRDSKGNQRRRHLKSMVGCLLLAGCTTSQSGGWSRSQLGTALSTQCCPRLCRPSRFAPGRLVAVLRPPPYIKKKKERMGVWADTLSKSRPHPLTPTSTPSLVRTTISIGMYSAARIVAALMSPIQRQPVIVQRRSTRRTSSSSSSKGL